MGVAISKVLALLALGLAGVLVVLDLTPGFTDSGPRQVLSAAPLAAVAMAYLIHKAIRRPNLLQALKAVLLSGAFALWAAHELLAPSFAATILNDLAIALFVIDMALVLTNRVAGGDNI